MNRRKVVIGLCMLCAMAISALAAQGASAQEAFTCAPVTGKEKGTKGFKDAHCKEAVENTEKTPEVVKYEHKSFSGPTVITGTNETTGGVKPVTKLHSVQAGTELELQSTELMGTGTMENSGGNASGTGVITYTGVTVTKPVGKGCKVKGEQVITEKLAATTAGLTNELKFTPNTGEKFAEFVVEGCSIGALNHAYTVTGSVKGQTNGATTTFTRTGTTEQGTLFMFGQKAGIEGTLTISEPTSGNGLALT